MIKITQLKLDINHSEKDLENRIRKLLKLKPDTTFTYEISKKSMDLRKKPQLYYVYTILVKVNNENSIMKKVNNNDITLTTPVVYTYNHKTNTIISRRPIIVGFGPAGMICGLMLAMEGYKPIIIERGDCVENRIKKVEAFWENNILDTETNVQFGEGGAGTFSDGKLNTMVKDTYGRIRKVLEIFVKHGAKEEILYNNKPHIGTDVLCNVVKSIRNEIISCGGEIRFNTKLTDVIHKNGVLKSIVVNDNETIECDELILALGHSARDTFYMLKNKNFDMEAKAFAMGVRVEHPQELINAYAYGNTDYTKLPTADYKLTYRTKKDRGVYSFCMCPGGYVVNASSEEKRLCVNGMSYSGRDSKNANSAIIVTVTPDDFGNDDILAGVEFQRSLEEAMYKCGNGKIPVQRLEDFINNQKTSRLNEVTPCIKGQYELSDLSKHLPEFMKDAIIEAFSGFANQIEGFDMPDCIISGIESRTSSPIRIKRAEDTLQSNIKGVYPCGEGAGYAGGITSAAIDGLRVFEKIYEKYLPNLVTNV